MPYTYRYPHPAVTTDCVILTFHEERLKILLIRRGIEPFKGCWALPGGFLRMDESAEEGALRELREETGVTGCAIKQFHTFSAPGRDPRERVITIAFYALMKWQQATGADDAEFADWIAVDSLPPLAFDHGEIVKMAMEAVKRDIFFEPVGFELLNEVFSMSELQKVYEAILGKEFDRRNFAKKMKHLDILEEAEKELPLPFLNSPRPAANNSPVSADRITANFSESFGGAFPESLFADNDFIDFNREATTNERLQEAQALHPDAPTRASRRKGLLWRLNRKKYDKLKDSDTLEF